MQAFHIVNLTLAFLLELAALAALGVWGYQIPESTLLKFLLGVGLPVIAAIAWGLTAAPKAKYQNQLAMIITKTVVFGGAALALFGLDRGGFAILFAILVIINLITLSRSKSAVGPSHGFASD